jgi:hypothetical protein
VNEGATEAKLWRANTLAFQSRQRLDRFEGDVSVAAELGTVQAAGSQAGAARLEESWERLSTMRFSHGPVTFAFKGSPDFAMPAAGSGQTAQLGAPSGVRGKVGTVGVSMGQGASAFASLANAIGAAQSFVVGRLYTFELRSEPLAPALDPGVTAAAQQPATGAAGARAPEQTSEVDGGLQYDLGSEVAVVAAYRYAYDWAAVGSTPFKGSAGPGQQSDEQLYAGSLRLVWRFTRPKEPRSAEPMTGDRSAAQHHAVRPSASLGAPRYTDAGAVSIAPYWDWASGLLR